jgi:Holliday junction DNA helicase RuvA
MIHYLNGTLVEALPTQIVVEAGGVGYEVLIPLSTYDKLPTPPAPLKILTYLQVREDAHVLYGFVTAEERDLFGLLVHHVSGIGPKSALAILSGTTPLQFRSAVVANDFISLSKIKGVGKKTAERLVVELRDKVGVSAAWESASAQRALSPGDQKINDAVLALISLGYKQAEAHVAVKKVSDRRTEATVEILIREALKAL